MEPPSAEPPSAEPPSAEPTFSGADLSGADLSGADLSGADLSNQDLSNKDLSGATLSGATLTGATLSGATLTGADLTSQDLSNMNLSRANLSGAILNGADLSGAILNGADLSGSHLRAVILNRAVLRDTNLKGADLSGVDLSEAILVDKNSLREAILKEANLSGYNLNNTDFSGMDLMGVNLNETSLIKTDFSHANLTNCSIYGIAAWDIKLDGAVQTNLTITPPDQPTITVDNIEIAQFIYLLLNNAKIRDVIDTIATKSVLILGRFTPNRKLILDALKNALRSQDYFPILFDFEKPVNQDVTETVSTLAHLAKFIIVDLTDPSCSPAEVTTIAPYCIRPIKPIFCPSIIKNHEYAMFRDLQRRYPWVLPTYYYEDLEDLLTSFQDHIIKPAEEKSRELKEK